MLQNISIKAKLAAAFGALALIVVVVATLAVRSLSSEHAAFGGYVREGAQRAVLANHVLDAANARAVGARNLVLVSAASDRAAELEATKKAHEQVAGALSQLRQALDKAPDATAQERRLFDKLVEVEARYGPLALEIVGMAVKGERDAAIAKMNADCRPLLAALIGATNDYLGHVTAQAEASLQASNQAFDSSRNILLGTSGLAVALAACLAWLITRLVVGPIDKAVAIAQTVAAGDLRSHIDVSSKDETGRLMQALKDMNDGLVGIVGNVRNGSESIAAGSQQIAGGSVDLSARTEEQAANLQETAASMEQMNATVKSNAATAQQASQLAGAASGAAAKGGAVVGQVVATMEEISASSRKIADIIGVIDGISFQTNILALNAAVEAARAGSEGRGFAVVAGEVRNLAQRSAEAAKQIKALIGSSVDKVEAGTRLVGDARATMDDIVTQVTRVSHLITEMDTATAEQASGIDQVNTAISLLDQTTQQNAALVEESTAAAEGLKQQAARLAEVVSVFKLAA